MAQIILDSANNVIQGDFDTATLSLRTRMQTSTTNATTGVYVVPNGSATSASIQMSNAADPTNASKIVVATNGSTDVQVVSGANGSGTYLPLSFYTNNDIRFQMGTSGELGVRTAPGTVSYGTSGQFLKSNGSGAGVSWGTAGGGFSSVEYLTSSQTWTAPASTTKIRVTVQAGGAGGAAGIGGNPGGAGATSSFGSLITCTGGSTNNGPGAGSDGSATVTGAIANTTVYSKRAGNFQYGIGPSTLLGTASFSATSPGLSGSGGVLGAGGGNNASLNGAIGGSGAFARADFSITGGTAYSVTVGGGGGGGSGPGSVGSAGGSSGNSGGTVGTSGGAGGNGSGGGAAGSATPGQGGPGGAGSGGTFTTASTGSNPQIGGAGGGTSSVGGFQSGAGGGGGIVIVEY